MAYTYAYGYGIRTGLIASQVYAGSQTQAYLARVAADGGIVQNPTYVYEWYKLQFELDGSGQPLQWRRKYNALGGVKLNGISNTNLLLRSQEFDNASWTKSNATISQNSTIAPDGTQTAETITDVNGAGFCEISQGSIAFANTTTYTLAIYCKANTKRYIRFAFQTTPFPASSAFFDLQDGVIKSASGVTALIFPAGNGWYRCVMTGTTTSAATGAIFISQTNDAGTSQAYTGTGTGSVFIWGAQLQTGSIATDYIPTEGATASATQNYAQTLYDFGTTSDARVNAAQATAANQPYWGLDSSLPSAVRGLVFDGSNDLMSVADLGIFNAQAAGTVVTSAKDYNRTGGDAIHNVLFISTNSATDPRVAVRTRSTTNIFAVAGRRQDGDTTVTSANAASAEGLNRLAGLWVWGGNTLEGVFNGTAATTANFSSGGGITSATDSVAFNIGAASASTSRLNGVITDVGIGRIAASSAQLAALRSLEKAFYPALP